MDQIQKLLCNMKKEKPKCLIDRNILRGLLADYLPDNKLKQNLLLNAFDNDVVQNLHKESDATLNALRCISQLENDWGITKESAFWSIQTWCYILGLEKVADALATLQPISAQPTSMDNTAVSKEKEYKIALGVYRSGIDFPAGEISVQVTTKPKYRIRYGVGKNPNKINTGQDFMDKMYIRVEEGHFLKLETVGDYHYDFIVKLIK